MANVTKPIILDETGQDIVTGLADIANAVQPINIYLDVQMSIPVEGWSDTNPHTYTWLYNRVTAECGIEVHFMEGAEDVDMKYLEYDKIAGGIQFEIDEIPDKAIPLMIRIINAQTSAVIDPVDDTLIASDAVPGTANVHEALVNHEERLSDAEEAVEAIDDKLETVDDELDLRLKSVNGIPGDEHGDVIVNETEFARQIVTDDAQQSTGLFLFRTTGGDASLSDGPAKLVSVNGRRVHTGEAVSQLNMTVNAAQRTAPAAITAVLDDATFEAYVEEAGVYTIIYTDSWSTSPALYGITVTNDPLYGDTISVSWDGMTNPVLTVTAPRVIPAEITATIDQTVFESYVDESGTYTLSYTTEWSEDPADYGVTVTNDPIDGDEIVIVYVKSDRGTITVSNPTKFISTGWNLYNNATGKKYAKVKNYSSTYGFLIGGSYASLAFAETLEGTQTAITPVSGYFVVPADGYVFVTGGDDTTYIMMTWSDWTEGYQGDFKTYEESVVDLAPIMTNFPYGLMQVGAVSDEINFSMMRAISRIERMAYSAENLAYAEASGRAYEADTNYIYIVKEVEDTYTITETGAYTACDHGYEIVDGNVPVYVQTLYGQNLVDKLRTDVVTISAQMLSALQKAQVRTNIGAGSSSDVNKLKYEEHNDLSSLDAIKTNILSIADEMASEEVRPYGFWTTGTGDIRPFQRGHNYYGSLCVLYKTSSILQITACLTSDVGDLIVVGYNSYGTVWTFNNIATRLNGTYVEGTENLNDYVTVNHTGLYNIGGTAPTNCPDTWCQLMVIASGSGVCQMLFHESFIAIRRRTGSPLAWTAWKYIDFRDTGWVYLKNETGSWCCYRVIGNVVAVKAYHKVEVSSIAAWSNLIFGTLPAGYRPNTIDVCATCVSDRDGDRGCALLVGDNGNVYIAGRYTGATSTGGIVQGVVTYAIPHI